ncbi:DNA topoisomerase IV subunit A [Jeotgalibaca caeni]|uniref:DNA topoisomerase IV subunit A n=1 Tax=Jeotgalibaca caeni TaxID=3028623 RepID=UPI00237E8878|nr:DNA topoisomerase IV subunit A [Jeotgalibaca caeni]MDE1548442.1 DNA topoisomerase IV subunit A [Jeotgalibaca caeni]
MAEEKNIKELMMEDVMSDRFGRYSKYIIQDRALPDIRDGLKPVQRRILYAMYASGNTAEKQFRKSAKTVGNVIGNYHPHGDSSVYEAMVRLSQDWKMREPLIEMHGNNGSMDGDPAAAMRYTEARLAKISAELLGDIDSDTVDFILNFDDTDEEPVVLPARYPNLLVNGTTGISAGYATDIPPHNLGEVIDATNYLIDHPDATLSQLMKYVKGPDFPTGAIVQGLSGLKSAYKTGKGKVVVRSKTSIEKMRGGKERIMITEIPYEVNKAMLVKKMDEIRLNRKVEGIDEVRDETDRTGLQIVVELKKEANAEGILNYLFKNTDLQVNYNFNMVAIDELRPQQVGLVEMLQAYINHKKEVTLRRTRYNLKKADARLHIVEALITVISVLDEVIQLIRNSKDKKDAKSNLMKTFNFSEVQAEAIVSLQLYRLTNTDIVALQNEKLDLNEQVASYQSILKNEKTLMLVMKNELAAIKKKYATKRLTVVEKEIEEIKIETEVLIPEEEVYVLLTQEGYYKRTSLRSFAASEISDVGLREGDQPLLLEKASTLDSIAIFTNKGDYMHFPVYELPELKWKDMGYHLSQNIPFSNGEEIIGATILKHEAPLTEHQSVLFVTQEGMIKQTALFEYQSFRGYRRKKSTAIKLRNNTDLVKSIHFVDTSKIKKEVLMVTHFGFALRYPLEEVSQTGIRTSGVKAINLKAEDKVVGAALFDEEDEKYPIFVVTQRGNAKRFRSGEVPRLGRAKRGLLLIKELKANPHRIVYMDAAPELDTIYEVRTTRGQNKELISKTIPFSARYTNGSSFLEEKEEGMVYSIRKVFPFSQKGN